MRGLLILLACMVAATILSGRAGANGFTKTDLALTMSDGVQIAATYYAPSAPPPASGWPAAMLLHGLGLSRTAVEGATTTSANGIAEQYLAPNDYAVLTFDARAHGASGGTFGLDGPREIQDVRELFAWLASRPGVDPARIGGVGISYGGGSLWRATAEGVPFATIVPIATWTDLERAIFPQELTKSGVVLGFLNAIPEARYAPDLLQLRTDLLANTGFAASRQFAAARSVRSQLASIRIPVFLAQGRRDFAFDIEQALAAYRTLPGPKRLYIGDFGHAPSANPPQEPPYLMTEMKLWLDRFLKSQPNGIDTRPPVELAPFPWTGTTVSYAALPPTRTQTSTLRPPKRAIPSAGKIVFTLPKATRVEETFGRPVVRLSATGTFPHVVATLSALTPTGETVVSSGGTSTRLSSRARTLTISLLSTSTPIPKGSRLRLTIAGNSLAQNPANLLYLVNVPAGRTLRLRSVRLSVPLLRTPVSR